MSERSAEEAMFNARRIAQLSSLAEEYGGYARLSRLAQLGEKVLDILRDSLNLLPEPERKPLPPDWHPD